MDSMTYIEWQTRKIVKYFQKDNVNITRKMKTVFDIQKTIKIIQTFTSGVYNCDEYKDA